MPLIRFTYARDIAREGAEPVEVSDERAALLFNQRRAVLVEEKPKPKRRKAK